MVSRRCCSKRCWCWLAVGLVLAPSAGRVAEAIDLSHIPARAVAAVWMHPEQLAKSAELEMVPWEVVQVTAQRELGFNPLFIQTAIGFAAASMDNAPPDWGVVLRFSQPQRLGGGWLDRTEEATMGQVIYRRSLVGRGPSICQFDAQTILIGTEPMLREMITTRDADRPLRQILTSTPMQNDINAVVSVGPLREMFKQFLAAGPNLPPPLLGLWELPDQLDTAMIALNLSRERGNGIKLIATDEAAAQKVESTLLQGLAFAKQMLPGQLVQSMSDAREDAEQQAMQQYLVRIANTLESRLRPMRAGTQLVVTLSADHAISAVLVAMLLPAVQASRDAARRTRSMNNLKQLGLAMHNFHHMFGAFPAAHNMNADGQPLLSWRVHLLPLLEEESLYDQFRLDESWDSPHNQRLIARMPDVFRAPGSQASLGKTNYLGVRGEEMALIAPRRAERYPQGSSLKEFLNSTSNTLMIVEADDQSAVEWTRPVDFEADLDQPLKGLVGLRPGGFQAMFADGSVRFISETIDPVILRRLFTKADGQPVRRD